VPATCRSAAALAFPLGYGVVGLWYGLALGLAIVALLLTMRLRHRSRGGFDRTAGGTIKIAGRLKD
jgi:MATE family multidrug resistance protein